MQHLHSDLGSLSSGAVVVVRLSGTEANVKLLDDTNLSRYKRGQGHEFYGGHYRRSPARISVPAAGHWHLVVDLGGRHGSVKASVSVVRA